MRRIEDNLNNKITFGKIKEYGFYIIAGIVTFACLYSTYKFLNKPGWEEREIILGPSNERFVVVGEYKKNNGHVTGLRPGEEVALRDPTIKLEIKEESAIKSEIKKTSLPNY